jgi:chromosome segregation ATPase
MKDVDVLFGMNAGKIWKALDSNNSLTKNQLIEITNLTDDEFNQAIGWLAKENKIKKEGEFFKLDNTNLSEKIEDNANKIYSIYNNGKFNIGNLSYLTTMNKEEFNLALGWLAREGKITDDILNNNSDLNSINKEIEKLRNEIQSLNDILVERDNLINQLSDQLVNNQFHKIEFLEENNKLKHNIEQINKDLFNHKNDLKTKKIEIEHLKIELNNLNSDIETRNMIIKQVTDQLTDKQTKNIENFNLIKKLERKLENNTNLIKMSNEKIQERINNISTIQSEYEKENYKSENVDSTLFKKPDSLLNKQETINCIDDEVEHSTLKKKDNKFNLK